MSRKKKDKATAFAAANDSDTPGPDDGVSGGPEAADPPAAEDAPHAETSPPVADAAAPTPVATPEATIPNALTAEDRVALLEKEKDDLRNRMLRIAADFENWKKRSRKDQADAEAKARESVLRDMLEVSDNLERATAAYGGGGSDPAAVLRGVELVLRLFQSKLDRHDVRPIETKGQPFDPRLHEAIAKVVTTEVAPGSVVNEMQRGYRMGDRLLRPAIVSVAAAPEPPPDETPASDGSATSSSEDPPSGSNGDGNPS